MRRWLMWCGIEWAVIAITMALTWRWPWLLPLAVIVIGSRQHALAVLGHEGAHHLIDGYRPSNDALAQALCFWPLGGCVQAFREFHLAHHAFVGTPDDPEIEEMRRRPDVWTNRTRRKIVRTFLEDLCGRAIPEAFGFIGRVHGAYGPARIAYLMAVGGTAVLTGLWPLLILWVWCIPTSMWAVVRLRVYREHLGDELLVDYPVAWWERLLYAPHNVWKHRAHHENWHISAWTL